MPMGIGIGLSVTRFESGIPGWMTGMDLGWDFTQNVQYSGATNPTDTHSATIYAQSAAGVWSPFAANTLVRTDLGLQTVPTRTNLALRSNEFDNGTIWINSNGVITVTANAGVAPDGTQTADQWTFGAQFDGKRQTISVTGGQTYTYSVFIRRVGGTGNTTLSLTMQELAPTNVTNVNAITITDQWARYSATRTFAAGTTSVEFHVQDRNASGQGTIQVWGAQVELASFASPPIVTTSSSATVNGNQQVVDLTGRLSAGVGGIMQVNVLETGSVVSRLLEINDGASSTNSVVAYLAASSNQIVFQTVVGGANTMLIYPEANAGSTGIMTIAFAASSNYLMVQVIGKTTPAAITSGNYPSGMSKFSFFGRGYDSQRNAYALTRRMALRFGAQNASTFADLFAKATLLAAVS